jgi:hypothetical protein
MPSFQREVGNGLWLNGHQLAVAGYHEPVGRPGADERVFAAALTHISTRLARLRSGLLGAETTEERALTLRQSVVEWEHNRAVVAKCLAELVLIDQSSNVTGSSQPEKISSCAFEGREESALVRVPFGWQGVPLLVADRCPSSGIAVRVRAAPGWRRGTRFFCCWGLLTLSSGWRLRKARWFDEAG